MSLDLNLDTLSTMKVAEYIKAFKNKTLWKKAKYVLVLMDYKLDGKKITVALPFKKPNEAKEAFKKIKKERLHLLKKTGVGSFALGAGDSGPEATVNFIYGGLSPEAVATKASKLFDKIKLSLLFPGGAAETVEEEEEEDNAPEADLDVEDTDDEVADTPNQEEPVTTAANLVEAIKAQFQQIKTDFNTFKSTTVPKVKDKSLAAADLAFIQELNAAISAFATAVAAAPAAIQAKLQAAVDKFKAQQPTLEKILAKFGTATATETTTTPKLDLNASQKRLEEIKARIAEIRAELAA